MNVHTMWAAFVYHFEQRSVIRSQYHECWVQLGWHGLSVLGLNVDSLCGGWLEMLWIARKRAIRDRIGSGNLGENNPMKTDNFVYHTSTVVEMAYIWVVGIMATPSNGCSGGWLPASMTVFHSSQVIRNPREIIQENRWNHVPTQCLSSRGGTSRQFCCILEY